MLTINQQKWLHALTIIAALSLPLSTACAQGKGQGKGGGGSGAEYTILAIPSPDGNPDRNSALSSISDPGPTGNVYLAGYYYLTGEDRAHCWTVDPAGNVTSEDLSLWFWNHDLDINSWGIVVGGTNADYPDRQTALLFPDGQFVILTGTNYPNESARLNNPNSQGVFQVVGRDVMWDVSVDGTVLNTRPLVDPQGTQLYGKDVNDLGQVAGFIVVDGEVIPAIGSFNSTGQLQIAIRSNPNPAVIEGFWDFQISGSGDLLGYGYEPSPGLGVYPRAVVWPAAGGATDLVSEFQSINTAQGNGIATVNGVMQVIGNASANSGLFPYVYKQAEMHDLNQLAEGDEPWEIQGVSAINQAGMICGQGRVGKRRNYRASACLLIPNP